MAISYQPAWFGGVLWDDDAHLTAGSLRSAEGLWRIWTDVGATQQYYPLTHSAFWVFYQLWGLNTLGYHLVNIALHATSAWLFARLLLRIGVPGAVLAAAVFALHPVHVESVAWMTELKNTLSTVLYLAATLAYLRFDRDRSSRWYAQSLVLFVGALLSKTVTATLPAALIILFWWRTGRVQKTTVRPLLPFFAVATAAGLLTVWFERSLLAARGAEYAMSFGQRVVLAGRAVWFYAAKILWPADLTFIYPRWQLDTSSLAAWLYPLLLAGVIVAAWMYRRRTRAPLAVALLYCGTLFPALGFANVYPFRYSFVADHFQYLASLPLIAALGAGVVVIIGRLADGLPRVERLAAALVGVALGVLTWQQAHDYRDSETLLRATLARNPDCWLCYNNLATARLHGSETEFEQATTYLQRAVALNPNSAEVHNNLGGAFQRQGRMQEALDQHLEALRLNPRLTDARYNAGVTYQALGRTSEAEAAYREVVGSSPEFAQAHANLGALLVSTGRPHEAVTHFSEAVRLRPGDWQTHEGLGRAFAAAERPQEALAALNAAARLAPDSPVVHNTRATVYLRAGDGARAIAEFRESVRLSPDPLSYYQLALALATTGRTEEAILEFRNSLKLYPSSAEVHHDLGAAFANTGRYREAAAEFEAALRLRPDYAEARDNLARVRALPSRR